MSEAIHFLRLDTFGGVEQVFHHYLELSSIGAHDVIVGDRGVHSAHRAGLSERVRSMLLAKYIGPFKVPPTPASLRLGRIRRFVQRIPPATMVFWNQFPRIGEAQVAQRAGHRIVYYDHGAAWLVKDTTRRNEFLEAVDVFACNSAASRRVLQLRLGVRQPVTITGLAVRPELIRPGSAARALPSGRPIRLGMAGRLVGLKGIPLAMRAVRRLRLQGSDYELRIAGSGPDQEPLSALCRELELEDRVRFLGHIEDMSAFYSEVDLLLAPSIHETFGLSCLEAAAHGCPSIVTRVDGLAEAVLDGKTGVTMRPTLPLSDYAALGGNTRDVPDSVYDPDRDELTAPRIVDPEVLAAAIRMLLEDPDLYQVLSRKGIRLAHERSELNRFVRDLDHCLAPALDVRSE